jgi:hypothetical protein
MSTLITGLLTISAFLGGVTGMLFLLAWLERPHPWSRRPVQVPSHRVTRSSS